MRYKATWIQVLGWVSLYILWVAVFQGRTLTLSRTATIQFCYLVFIAGNYYFNVLVTVPGLLYRKKYVRFGGTFLAGVGVTALLRVPVVFYINTRFFASAAVPSRMAIFSLSFLNIGIWSICLLAARLTFDRFALEREKTKAELDFLNAQFNPHFLFNSINSIYAHIDKRNATARNMLLTFSDMLRYQLYECNTDRIPVEKEMNYIRNYVALQQARKGEGLTIRLCIEEDVRGFPIAPLLFIAFIENAFKYVGHDDRRENTVCILFRKSGDRLEFRCTNTREARSGRPMGHNGIGIDNARRRMALLYPSRHDLMITETDNLYDVHLTLRLT